MQEYTDPAIRITLLPRDTNSRGTIFGGVILSYIDTAGASTTDPLYALLAWDSDQTVSTTYTLQFDAAGLLFIDTT